MSDNSNNALVASSSKAVTILLTLLGIAAFVVYALMAGGGIPNFVSADTPAKSDITQASWALSAAYTEKLDELAPDKDASYEQHLDAINSAIAEVGRSDASTDFFSGAATLEGGIEMPQVDSGNISDPTITMHIGLDAMSEQDFDPDSMFWIALGSEGTCLRFRVGRDGVSSMNVASAGTSVGVGAQCNK